MCKFYLNTSMRSVGVEEVAMIELGGSSSTQFWNLSLDSYCVLSFSDEVTRQTTLHLWWDEDDKKI